MILEGFRVSADAVEYLDRGPGQGRLDRGAGHVAADVAGVVGGAARSWCSARVVCRNRAPRVAISPSSSGHGRRNGERCPIVPTGRRTPARGARGPPARGRARRQLEALGLKPTAIARRVSAGRLHRVHVGVYAVGHSVLGPTGGGWPPCSHAGGRRAEPRLRGRPVGTTRELGGSHRRHRPPRRRPQAAATAHPPCLGPESRRGDDASRRPRHDTRSDHPRPGGDPSSGAPRERPRPKRDPRAHRLPRPRRPGESPRPPPRSGRSSWQPSPRTTPGRNLTRSGLEILFRRLCHDHGLPTPRVNTTIHGKEVDFLFEAHRLIVETDSWRYHRTRRAFEEDRARDVLTTKAGYRTLRFTDRRLTEDPTSVAAAIHAILADRRAA